jgi:hypothetical protein
MLNPVQAQLAKVSLPERFPAAYLRLRSTNTQEETPMKFAEGLTYLFKGMLFLDGHLTAAAIADEPFRELGNRSESERVFGPALAKQAAETGNDGCLPAGCN